MLVNVYAKCEQGLKRGSKKIQIFCWAVPINIRCFGARAHTSRLQRWRFVGNVREN